MGTFSVVVIIILVLAVVFALAAAKVVPQGEEHTIERLGRFTRTIKPGLRVILPFVDRVAHRVNMMETVQDVPSQEVITRDNAMITVDGVVYFQVLDAAKASYEINNRESAIINLTTTNIRTVMGSMDMDDLLSNRNLINERLLRVVDQATQPWGVKVTRIEIKDINPPKDLVDAMARQMKAEREKRANILDAQGSREAAILRAEGEKQAAILLAEGAREASFREAEAREREAEAEARATQMVSDAIGAGDVQALNYFVAQKYVASLESIASANNEKVVFMPLETTSLLGSIGGISELAKGAFAGMSGQTAGSAAKAARSGPSLDKTDLEL
ncbi:MAG: SPFH domain-containing protein [Granulosicoccaceae bacterium]